MAMKGTKQNATATKYHCDQQHHALVRSCNWFTVMGQCNTPQTGPRRTFSLACDQDDGHEGLCDNRRQCGTEAVIRRGPHLDGGEDVRDGNTADDEEDDVADDADVPAEGALHEHAGAQRPLLLRLLQNFCNLSHKLQENGTCAVHAQSRLLVTLRKSNVHMRAAS